MKYFAVAVIFGLFAISQALPVEERRYKIALLSFTILLLQPKRLS
jgi:hypothetical protein